MNTNSSLCPECGKPLPEGAYLQLCPACLMAQAMASRTLEEADGKGGGSQSAPLTPEELADKFPQFEILECLGRGGMGVVYKARQKSLNRLVALKILAPERVKDPRFAERFAREAELLAKLSHPHIVTIHDFGESHGLYYLVMEFVNGVNLRELLREGKMPPEQALAIIPPICDALQFAHEHGVVHRDIKPENLLLDREGRAKIADFGIATLAGDGADRCGTPAYMAPEQAAAGGGRIIDHRADIYALGVVLYEMLTGERPAASPVPPSRRVLIDVRLDEVVLRALETKPELRYQTAGEIRTQLETLVDRPAEKKSDAPAVRARDWRGLVLHFLPALLLVVAWFSSGLEKGAVLILSILLVAVLVMQVVWRRKGVRALAVVLSTCVVIGLGGLMVLKTKTPAPARVAAPSAAPPPSVAVAAEPLPPGLHPSIEVDGVGAFATLAEALAHAPEDGVLRLPAGIYAERIAITRPVRLIGAGWDRTRVVVEMGNYKPFTEPLVPAIRIAVTGKVAIEGIGVTMKGTPKNDSYPVSLIRFERGDQLLLKRCALLGSPGDGLVASPQTFVAMEGCLVAATWGTGIAINGVNGAEIRGCEIRNCHYAGIVASRSQNVSITGCRISGAAWHGIRFDDCSPEIRGNLIHSNARSGIYVSGDTGGKISGNTIVRNEIGGISCWFESRDLIERNLIDGLMVLGMSSPRIVGNVFLGRGLTQGQVSDERLSGRASSPLTVENNVFWQVSQPWMRTAPALDGKTASSETIDLPAGNTVEDPHLTDGERLADDSPLHARNIGPAEPFSLAADYPLQPEEKAIIPDGPTRDVFQWKR